MRRAAVSVPSNIAEGYRRNRKKEYAQFLRIALGSCAELETQLSLANDLNHIRNHDWQKINGDAEATAQLLYRLIESISK